MTLSDIVLNITGESAMGEYTGGRVLPTRDEIARLAYQYYEARGRREGGDVDDWLAAETHLIHHYR